MNIMMGKTTISICAADRQPLTADAIVEEQDTCLVLGTEPVIRDTRETYEALVSKMERQKPLLPGQLMIKNTVPLRITAVLYDIEQTPVCSGGTVAMVLNNLLDTCSEYRLKSVIMPLLGCSHGGMKVSAFITLLQNILNNGSPAYPEKIIFTIPSGDIDDVADIIEKIAGNSKPA
jgi:hypothetical protein